MVCNYVNFCATNLLNYFLFVSITHENDKNNVASLALHGVRECITVGVKEGVHKILQKGYV